MAITLNFVSASKGMVDFTVNTGKKVYTKKYNKDGSFSHDGFAFQVNPAEKTIGMILEKAIEAKPLTPLKSEFSINQRFSFLEKFTNMVINGDMASAIVTGEGGLGKSHTVMSQLAKKGLTEITGEGEEVENENGEKEYIVKGDYKVVKGYATPKALYATLYENRHNIVIFDDCDSVLKDPTALNILKGALDSYDKRTVSWLSRGFIDDGLPNSFEFYGQIIFISNLSSDKVDQAVKSRSMCIDLSMSLEDKIERMTHILPEVLVEYPLSMKKEALKFMTKHAEEAVEFNMRTLMKVIKVAHAYGVENPEWKDAAKYLLTNV